MQQSFEELKGFIKAFEVINEGNYEGTDYLIDVIDFDTNELISLENYLHKNSLSNKKTLSFDYEKTNDWTKTLNDIFKSYFVRNVQPLTNLYKITFIQMLNNYIDKQPVKVLTSGIEDGCSCLTEYIGEVSGSDMLFVFQDKILLLHFGIND